jgi:hypothetical protein
MNEGLLVLCLRTIVLVFIRLLAVVIVVAVVVSVVYITYWMFNGKHETVFSMAIRFL